jgi:hypothetical protein
MRSYGNNKIKKFAFLNMWIESTLPYVYLKIQDEGKIYFRSSMLQVTPPCRDLYWQNKSRGGGGLSLLPSRQKKKRREKEKIGWLKKEIGQ